MKLFRGWFFGAPDEPKNPLQVFMLEYLELAGATPKFKLGSKFWAVRVGKNLQIL